MNTLTKKLLPLTLSVIAITSLFCVQPARADYIVTLNQVGANVVANGSGAINLMGLIFVAQSTGGIAHITANNGNILTGLQSDTDTYGGFTGPANFGSGGPFLANTSSGDFVGINASFGSIFVPRNYSGAGLTDSMTFNNATFASLGLTPGTYVWTWGTGLPNQSFTVQIGPAGVPDSGSTVSLFGCALLGLAALRRKLSC